MKSTGSVSTASERIAVSKNNSWSVLRRVFGPKRDEVTGMEKIT